MIYGVAFDHDNVSFLKQLKGMGISYKLAKRKSEMALVIVILLGIAFAAASALWESGSDQWIFSHMTSKQHLWEAKKTTPDAVDIDVALGHLSAIPSNAPEAR